MAEALQPQALVPLLPAPQPAAQAPKAYTSHPSGRQQSIHDTSNLPSDEGIMAPQQPPSSPNPSMSKGNWEAAVQHGTPTGATQQAGGTAATEQGLGANGSCFLGHEAQHGKQQLQAGVLHGDAPHASGADLSPGQGMGTTQGMHQDSSCTHETTAVSSNISTTGSGSGVGSSKTATSIRSPSSVSSTTFADNTSSRRLSSTSDTKPNSSRTAQDGTQPSTRGRSSSSNSDSKPLSPAAAAWRAGRLGVSLSGGGFLGPYHTGVLHALSQLGVITAGVTPVVGASAGSLAAASFHVGLDLGHGGPAMRATKDMAVAARANPSGARHQLDAILATTLSSVLPPGCAVDLNGSGVLGVAVTRLTPAPRVKVVSEFRSDQDLVDALRASCYLPRFSSPSLTTSFRGSACIDGGILAWMPPLPRCMWAAGARAHARARVLSSNSDGSQPAAGAQAAGSMLQGADTASAGAQQQAGQVPGQTGAGGSKRKFMFLKSGLSSAATQGVHAGKADSVKGKGKGGGGATGSEDQGVGADTPPYIIRVSCFPLAHVAELPVLGKSEVLAAGFDICPGGAPPRPHPHPHHTSPSTSTQHGGSSSGQKHGAGKGWSLKSKRARHFFGGLAGNGLCMGTGMARTQSLDPPLAPPPDPVAAHGQNHSQDSDPAAVMDVTGVHALAPPSAAPMHTLHASTPTELKPPSTQPPVTSPANTHQAQDLLAATKHARPSLDRVTGRHPGMGVHPHAAAAATPATVPHVTQHASSTSTSHQQGTAPGNTPAMGLAQHMMGMACGPLSHIASALTACVGGPESASTAAPSAAGPSAQLHLHQQPKPTPRTRSLLDDVVRRAAALLCVGPQEHEVTPATLTGATNVPGEQGSSGKDGLTAGGQCVRRSLTTTAAVGSSRQNGTPPPPPLVRRSMTTSMTPVTGGGTGVTSAAAGSTGVSGTRWPYSCKQMFELALQPGGDAFLEWLADRGRYDAAAWAVREGLVDRRTAAAVLARITLRTAPPKRRRALDRHVARSAAAALYGLNCRRQAAASADRDAAVGTGDGGVGDGNGNYGHAMGQAAATTAMAARASSISDDGAAMSMGHMAGHMGDASGGVGVAGGRPEATAAQGDLPAGHLSGVAGLPHGAEGESDSAKCGAHSSDMVSQVEGSDLQVDGMGSGDDEGEDARSSLSWVWEDEGSEIPVGHDPEDPHPAFARVSKTGNKSGHHSDGSHISHGPDGASHSSKGLSHSLSKSFKQSVDSFKIMGALLFGE